MKKLLLNLLFVFGSALIFIQCAKQFSTTEKKMNSKLHQNENNTLAAYNTNSVSESFINKQKSFLGLRNAIIMPFFNNQLLPYQMMEKINGRRIFYNPYILFKDYTLASSYRQNPSLDK